MKLPPSYRMKSRMVVVLVGMIVFGFCIVIHSLYKIQIVEGQDMQDRALSQQMREERVGAERGIIYDTNGKVMAQSVSVWQICVSPGDVENASQSDEDRNNRREMVINTLYDVLGVEKEYTAKVLENTSNYYTVVKKRVEREAYEELMRVVNEDDIKGIRAEEMTVRRYPYGNMASTVLGFTNDDNVGANGLESYYDKTLSGTPGRVVSLRSRNGSLMPLQYEQSFNAQDGNSLILTIDEQLQHYLEKNLEIAVKEHRVGNRVSGIIMDVKTGAILAMSSKPDFDPNDPYVISDEGMLAELEQIKKDSEEQVLLAETKEDEETAAKAYSEALWKARNTMWRNKAVSDPYEPGSVFKIVTLSTALETGAASLNTSFNCIGYKEVAGHKIRCHVYGRTQMGHGAQDLTMATKNSCNPAFIELGLMIGASRFTEYFSNFGLTSGTQIDVPGEANSIYHTNPTISNLASSAFGQTIKLTPIQLITACCAAVNGGNLMQPYVVKQVVDSSGNVISNTDPFVKRQVISTETSALVRGILEQVVADGSGRQAKIPGYRIGGKTGTSEKLDSKDKETGATKNILSFFGFAPADDPQIACLVILDEPNIYNAWGSTIAAPIVGSIFADALPYIGIDQQLTEADLEAMSNQVKYLVNMDIHDAESTLRALGQRYRIIGNGTKVLQQMPGAGEILPAEGAVVLYTTEVDEENVVEVPDVVGKTPQEANSLLAGLGLNVSVVGEKLEGVSLVASGQQPAAGTKVPTGTVVTVTFVETAVQPASADGGEEQVEETSPSES